MDWDFGWKHSFVQFLLIHVHVVAGMLMEVHILHHLCFSARSWIHVYMYFWCTYNVCRSFKRFTFEKMGWRQEKVDEILLPVLKRMNARESQRQPKITQFLPSLPSSSSSSPPSLASLTKQRRSIKSKRIRNVVARLTAGMLYNASCRSCLSVQLCIIL